MATTAPAARRTFKVLGTTDDVTQCELCGKAELKGTVVLEFIDADGNGTGEVVYYGASCGARAAGWKTTDVRRMAAQADREAAAKKRAEEEAARAAQDAEENRRFDAWLLDTYGTTDRSAVMKIRGERTLIRAWTDFDNAQRA